MPDGRLLLPARRPVLRPRSAPRICVVPINKNGNTVEVHGWYEQHLFPDRSPLAQGQQGQ